ncbi:hypothetical protein D9603_04820 [Pseudoalteromonas sp. PS5]|nr:hypothetical protein D9603_04820 [Pseudoalteromonas sp. PS5]
MFIYGQAKQFKVFYFRTLLVWGYSFFSIKLLLFKLILTLAQSLITVTDITRNKLTDIEQEV